MVIYFVRSVVPFTYILEGRSHNSSLAYKVFYGFKVQIGCCLIQWSVLLNRERFNKIASINLHSIIGNTMLRQTLGIMEDSDPY